MVKYVSTYTKVHIKKISEGLIKRCLCNVFVCVFFFPDFLKKNSICCGYPFELHWQVDAIQMGTNNICLYKEVNKKYTGCNLKTTELLDCAIIGVCVVNRSMDSDDPDQPAHPQKLLTESLRRFAPQNESLRQL